MKIIVALLASLVALSATGTSLQFVSQGNSIPSDTAAGFSGQPIVSGDGRYVLFASTANNLVLSTTNTSFPAALNVYLRDRASNTTFLVSADLAGVSGGDDDSVPTGLSDDGNFLLFESRAGNLVQSDTNTTSDVFIRNLTNSTTYLISVNTNGFSGNGESCNSVCTPDGRYVAFSSAASDLVENDTNRIRDVFLRDLQTGTTRCVSVGAKQSSSTTPSWSDMPAISADGRYIAFCSSASNLVSSATNASEIYVRDMVAQTTIWASINAQSLYKSVAGQSAVWSYNVNISGDGNYVAFETSYGNTGIILRYCLSSGQTDLVYTNALSGNSDSIQNLNMSADGQSIAFVANVGTGGKTAIYSWNAQTGIAVPVSVDTNNALPSVSYCDNPIISSNGQYVTFLAYATGLTANTQATNGYHWYVRNLQSGTMTLLDDGLNGATASAGEAGAGMSADGSVIGFGSSQGSLVPNDHNRNYDVFVRDINAPRTELISARHPSLAWQLGGLNTISAQAISGDGRHVAFASDASDLVNGDMNQLSDVFVKDLYTGSNVLVSITDSGSSGNGSSFEPVISGNGRYVTFTSFATNLCAGDVNNRSDVFVRDLQAGTTSLVSLNTAGTRGGNNDSYAPRISSDGRFILFLSKATDVAGGLPSGYENLFVRDQQNSATCALTTTGQSLASMTPDGNFIAYTTSSGTAILFWDSQADKTIVIHSVASTVRDLVISPDGNRIVYSSGSSYALSVWDRVGNKDSLIVSGAMDTRFSANGQFLTYVTSVNFIRQVYLYNFQTSTSVLVSHQTNSASPANNRSELPDISADGRFVVYRSLASDIVAGDTNGVSDVFLYDSKTAKNTILSGAGSFSGNNSSSAPVFSRDGKTIVFQSWASNLMPGDFNQSIDLFAFPFLYAGMTVDTQNNPVINWPATPDQVYTVEYKDQLSDATWRPIPSPVTIVGNRGYLTNSALPAAFRFYRVSSSDKP